MTLHVHIMYAPTDALDQLQDQLDNSITLTCGDNPPPNATYDVLVAGHPTHDLLTASPALRALVIPWVGLPTTTRDLLGDYPHLAVYNLHHNTIPTAEMALALLFAAAKTIVPVDRTFRQGDWTPRYEAAPATLLHGKTALILGYGAIGQHIATVLRALGMNILGIRRSVTTPRDGVYPVSALHALLMRAQVLMVVLPGTSETECLLDAEAFTLIRPGALLVNVGRASVIDQHALYEALVSGHLAAAGLDVWYNYPRDEAARTHTLPADAPLHELDNVVMSPHRAGMGGSEEIEQMRMDALADLLNALAAGEEPRRVDVQVGY